MRVLFFSPHAGIWQHAYPEALIADALRTNGADLVYVTCGGAFASGCVTMAARGIGAGSTRTERERICVECRTARDHLRAGFGFRSYDIDSVLDTADERAIDAVLDSVSPSEISALEIDGVQIGRVALYEFLIERKKLALELTSEEWAAFRPRLQNTLRSLTAATRILDRERPDRVVVYNSLYSVNGAWRAAADRRGVPFYSLHGGLSLSRRLQRVMIGRDTALDWWARVVAAWPAFRDVPCNGAALAEVTAHFLHLFRGTSVFAYSAPKAASSEDVRGRFGVRPDQKLLVAAMSSYDEYVAAAAVGAVPDPSSLLFPTQVAWARALVEWARTRPDRFVLLRVHPREFPNKRESRKSEHAAQLEKELASLPDNVRVNWPSDQISIYDVAEYADVILNSWSTAGREMAALGIPVVTYCPEALMYPADLNYVGKTHDTYFAAIEEALRDGWSFERMRRAFRWCVLELTRGLVDIGDAYDAIEDQPTSFVQRVRNFVLARPAIRHRYDLARRPEKLAECARIGSIILGGKHTLLDVEVARRPVDEATETLALRREVRRLVNALYGNDRTPIVPGTLRAHLSAAAL